jgi:hypothetical protein
MHLYLSAFYLMTLSISHIVLRRIVGRLANSELENVWREEKQS